MANTSERAQKLKEKIEASMKEILQQAKEAEASLAAIQAKIAQLDKEAARSEFSKLRLRLQGQLLKISQDFGVNSSKFRGQIDQARTRVRSTLKDVKEQVRAIAEAERAKRRGRSRSE